MTKSDMPHHSAPQDATALLSFFTLPLKDCVTLLPLAKLSAELKHRLEVHFAPRIPLQFLDLSA